MPWISLRLTIVASLLSLIALPPLTGAEDPQAAPQGAPPAAEPSPAPSLEDPCRELRDELQRLKQSRTRPRGATRKKQVRRVSRGQPKAAAKGSRRAAASRKPSPPPSATTRSDTVCSGALTRGEVDRILETTRDFSGKNLNCLDLSGYDLRRANFTGATMIRTILSRASLDEANLERTDLSRAVAVRASFHLAGITGAVFDEAVLDGSLWTDRRICLSPSTGRCRDSFHSP